MSWEILSKELDLGLCPRPRDLSPCPNPEAGHPDNETGCPFADTPPPRSWTLDRRSGRFPALPYPPPGQLQDSEERY